MILRYREYNTIKGERIGGDVIRPLQLTESQESKNPTCHYVMENRADYGNMHDDVW